MGSRNVMHNRGMEIAGSVVLITGAAQRVGRAVALDLAKHSAHIAFSYYLESEPWRATAEAIERLACVASPCKPT